jgi:hypothetical protein
MRCYLHIFQLCALLIAVEPTLALICYGRPFGAFVTPAQLTKLQLKTGAGFVFATKDRSSSRDMSKSDRLSSGSAMHAQGRGDARYVSSRTNANL